MQQSTGELLLPAALCEAHGATKRKIFQLDFLPRTVAAAPVTPLSISDLAMLGGGCALFPAFAPKQKSGLHVSFLLLAYMGAFGSHQISGDVTA